jgi:5-deoxy-D-glucuronate isomerase
MIKLTNAAEMHSGKPLIINMDYIISMFEASDPFSGKTVTVLYSSTKETWQVQESTDEIAAMLKMPVTKHKPSKAVKSVISNIGQGSNATVEEATVIPSIPLKTEPKAKPKAKGTK